MLQKVIEGQEAQWVPKVHGVQKAHEVGADQEERRVQLAPVVLEVLEGIEGSQGQRVPEDTEVITERPGHLVQGAQQVPGDTGDTMEEEKEVN